MKLDHLLKSRGLLVGSLSWSYRNLYVLIHTNSSSIQFHDGACGHDSPSVLMSHVGFRSGFPFRDLCVIPSVCHLRNRLLTNTILFTFQFECMCTSEHCSELLLWLWPQPGAAISTVCEIEVVINDWEKQVSLKLGSISTFHPSPRA